MVLAVYRLSVALWPGLIAVNYAATSLGMRIRL